MSTEARNAWTTLFAGAIMIAVVLGQAYQGGCFEPAPEPAYKCDDEKHAAWFEECLSAEFTGGRRYRADCRAESDNRYCWEVEE